MTQSITIATDHFVRQISQKLNAYPPTIKLETGELYNFPYELNDIISRCVKEAARPTTQFSQTDLYREVDFNLRYYDKEHTRELLTAIRDLIQYLVTIFSNNGWYDSERTAPHRFVGYANHICYDIELRRN